MLKAPRVEGREVSGLAQGTAQDPIILDRHSNAQPCLLAAQDLTVRSVEEQVGHRVDVELDFLGEVYLQGQYRAEVLFPTVVGGDNCHAIRQRQACTLRGLRRRVGAAKGRKWPFCAEAIPVGHEGQGGVTVTPTSSPPSASANAVNVGSSWPNEYTLCSLTERRTSMVAVVTLGSCECVCGATFVDCELIGQWGMRRWCARWPRSKQSTLTGLPN